MTNNKNGEPLVFLNLTATVSINLTLTVIICFFAKLINLSNQLNIIKIYNYPPER